MLGEEEDVFESVAWDTPTAGYQTALLQGEPSTPAPGPGFKQSTAESVDGRGPHDPKWEGYLLTSVRDPVKELAETKDAYVSYLVSAKVSTLISFVGDFSSSLRFLRQISPHSPVVHHLLDVAFKISYFFENI